MSHQDNLAPKLPYDVVLCIIEAILAESVKSSDRLAVLRTFSLVSYSFVSFCQRKLFRRYNMGRIDGRKCYSILQHSPHLIPYVQEVWINLGWAGVVNVTVAEMEVLRVLTSLHHLSVLQAADPAKHSYNWSQLSLSVRRTIVNLLLRPQITSFTIRGVEALPFSLLSTWAGLKYLDVQDENSDPSFRQIVDDNAESDEESEDEQLETDFNRLSLSSPRQPPENSAVIALESLSLIDSDNMLLYMLLDPTNVLEEERRDSPFIPSSGSPNPNRASGLEISATYRLLHADNSPRSISYFDFKELRHLIIDLTPSNLFPVWHLINEARNSLKVLDIRQRFEYRRQQDPFGFNSSLEDAIPVTLPEEISLISLVNLQSLSITILLLVEMPTHPDTLSSWYSLLRRAPYGIKTLDITLDAFYFTLVADLLLWFPDLEDDDDVKNTPLSGLDEIISSPDYFPSLERVTIRVELPEDERLEHSDGSDVTFDVVNDQDVPAIEEWIEKIYASQPDSPAEKNMAVDVVTDEDLALFDATGGNYEPPSDYSESARTVSNYMISEPSFSSDASMWSMSHPVAFERVTDSITHMLQLTVKRFGTGSRGSLVVEVDFGGHMRR